MPDKTRQFNRYLITRARLGDRAALEQLVSRYQRKFLGHAFRYLGDIELAKEAVQEGWVDILRGLHKLQVEDAFSAWAFRIVTRKCSRHIARRQKNKKVHKHTREEINIAPTASDDMELVLRRGAIRKALEKLPEGHRAAVGLFYLEEMNVAEVAVALEIPVGTVKTRLMHARKKLRMILEGDDNGQTRQNDP